MFDLTGQQVLLRFAALLLILATHGFFVAWLAMLMGDKGPRYDGRLSLNPLRHFEPIGALSAILFRSPWLRPVAVDPKELRWPVVGIAVIILGSLALTVLVALALWLLRPTILTTFPDTSLVRSILLWIDTTATMSVWFAAINLIPIPPFTGGLVLTLIAPDLYRRITKRIIIPAIAVGIVLFAINAANNLSPAVRAVARYVLN
ncbi:MAG: hypothetical protein KIS96_12305 [Bauldia sp.]|nr:hypothetical protein [Bauldia sp.]